METRTFIEQPNAHCASIISHQGNIIIAYYNGPECTDRQAVQILTLNEKLTTTKKTRLMDQTGNPILFTNGTKLFLLCSYFEDKNENNKVPQKPVDRWKYCSIWQTGLSNTLHIESMTKLSLPIGLVPRCNPIYKDSTILFPLYREYNSCGIIFHQYWYKSLGFNPDTDSGSILGYIGNDEKHTGHHFGNGVLIQPTLWYEDGNFHTLSRDISGQGRAWYSISQDCISWSKPIQSNIDNDNNSIVVIPFEPRPLVVWNEGPGRSILNLGYLDKTKQNAIKITQLNKNRASYPNYCFDEDKNLYIIHTDGQAIAMHKFNRTDLENIRNTIK